jgi:uncharacterized protein with HEPN domain
MSTAKRPDIPMELALGALRQAAAFLAGCSLDTYLRDDMRRSAVERQLEIAGDALGQLRRLDPKLFERVPNGDLVIAFRNVLAHGYASLDHRRVHAIASTQLAPLQSALVALLVEFPE